MPARILDDVIPIPEDFQDDVESPASLYSQVPTSWEGDIVISGISGRLPESENLQEFKQNLFNGKDMVTDDDRRWKPGLYGLPKRSGKLKNVAKFDATYFGVHPKQADTMDPQLRMLLEVTHEAIVDSGTNPSSIRGTKTGVFIGASASEAHEAWACNPQKTAGYSMTGCTRSMFANRLSYFFDFKGPSFAMDTACSSSLLALDQAIHSLHQGHCTAAIVGGCSVCLKPLTALQFLKLGMLSPEGSCKSFDANGNGYCRSEGIVVIYLQRKPDAKRIYSTVVHSKTNSDGCKEQGITFPSGSVQKDLLYDVYMEVGVPPSQVVYVEAHGTGTKAGDPQEVNTIVDVFCKDRQGPLPIGSVKSNMGHAEPASGLAAVAKVVLSMEEQMIPANLHFKEPNQDIPGLVDGRLQVVTENMKMKEGFVGINSFGFGGSNVHAILKSWSGTREEHVASKSRRLFVYSGRTGQGVEDILRTVKEYSHNIELQALLNDSANPDVSTEMYRGFTILNGSSEETFVQKHSGEKRPTWFVFSGMGTQWQGMGRDLMVLDVFKNSIQKSDAVLSTYSVKLYDLIMKGEEGDFNDTVNSFVCIAAIQVALVDTLNMMGISPDGIVGHSVGELGCGYADGSLTAEETVLAAYWRGRCIKESNLPPGGMAAVGLTWEEACELCPPGVVPACHNSEDTVTISGPKETVSKFVNQLKEKQIFAKEVNSSGVAFHSYYMAKIAPVLKAALDKVIVAKPRSKRWISSSIPECKWDSDLAQYSSSEYHVNNLISPVLFQEALQHVPSNAIVIEIAPHCLLQAILKRSLSPSCCNVGLLKRGHSDNLEHFFSAIGKCYTYGLKVNPLKLYPAVSFPVSKGTPMISPLIQSQWDHSTDWDVPTVEDFSMGSGTDAGTVTEFDFSPDSPDNYLKGHCIDGRVLFPATGYLVLAWQALARIENQICDEMPVVFSDIMIHKATILPNEGKIKFKVVIMQTTGEFEISESNTLSVSGKIRRMDEKEAEQKEEILFQGNVDLELNGSDVYKELRLRGYDYDTDFRGIVASEINGKCGELLWNNNWVTFMDTMLQISILRLPGSGLRLPTRIKSIQINPSVHSHSVFTNEGCQQVVKVHTDEFTDRCVSGGVTIHGLHASTAPRRQQQHKAPTLEEFRFVPYVSQEYVHHSESLSKYATLCRHYAVQSLVNLHHSSKNNIVSETFKAIISQIKCEMKMEMMSKMDDPNISESDTSLLKFLQQNHNSISYEKANILQNDRLLQNLAHVDVFKPALDIVIENCTSSSLNVLEIDAGESGTYRHVIPHLQSHPMMSVNYGVTECCDDVIPVEDIDQYHLSSYTWNLSNSPPEMKYPKLVILQNTLHKQPNINVAIQNISTVMADGGFLLVQEITNNFPILMPLRYRLQKIEDGHLRSCYCFCDESKWLEIFDNAGFNLIYKRSDGILSSLFLLRKKTTKYDPIMLDVSCLDCTWLDDLKLRMAENDNKNENLWLRADKGDSSGVVGMVNCLRRESGGSNIRCILNASLNRGIKLNLCKEELEKLKELDVVMNVYRDGCWGSFRHLPLNNGKPVEKKECQHAYVNVLTRGDLSSLHWVESPLKYTEAKCLCKVNYAALNFRDIMLATGRLPPDAIPGDLAQQDCILGMEFSGYNYKKGRVMGLVPAKGLATTVNVSSNFLWNIPDSWSLEQAATVPVVYTTVYYALVIRGRIRKGEKVLIHSGSGGVGQAAISVALHHGCEVFTTVGTKEKKEFLKSRFPQLQDYHFSNSRDTTFEKHILTVTKGKGVDVVLNSLSEEKLQASIQVLAQHGRFLEIGKYDLSNNTPLGMAIFLKNITFHGILLDALFDENNEDWQEVSKLLNDGIHSGAVQPLQSTAFGKYQLEEAFRFMAQGKHIGKVLIKTTEDNSESFCTQTLAIPRSICHPNKSYIITGGLGGFGLELSEWLIERGARHLVLTSRSGVKTGYQRRKLLLWARKGVEVVISKRDLQSEADTRSLIEESSQRAPVGGVFHLAMVLKDGLIENQSLDNFQAVCKPKIYGTKYLDDVTRELCKKSLDWFVVYSSVSCGRGNAGQANYGLANSYMERICEQRHRDGFPGLAIQWGAIGDVGVVLETMGNNNTVIGGTLPQRMMSCLSTLDQFLNIPAPVVSSFVQADTNTDTKASGSGQDLVQTVCNILGIKDVNSVSAEVSLGDLGLDSLMGVEIKQSLERDFDLTLSATEIRQLTIKKLKEMSHSDKGKDSADRSSAVRKYRYNIEEMMPSQPIMLLKGGTPQSKTLFIVHPLEGDCWSLQELTDRLPYTVYGLQNSADVPLDSVTNMASYYLKKILAIQDKGPYLIAGYSFGACIAMEITTQIEMKEDSVEKLFLLDGSHTFVSSFTGTYRDRKTIQDDRMAETETMCSFVQQFMPGSISSVMEKLDAAASFDERVRVVANILMTTGMFRSIDDLEHAARNFYKRLMIAENFTVNHALRCPVLLVKAVDSKIDFRDEDYGLSKVCSGELEVVVVNGDHETFIQGENADQTASHIHVA